MHMDTDKDISYLPVWTCIQLSKHIFLDFPGDLHAVQLSVKLSHLLLHSHHVSV